MTRWILVGVFVACTTFVQAGNLETIAGTGKEPDGGVEGPALTTNLGNPFGVEIGPDGALYICEVSNHRVRRLDLKTNKLTTVAGSGKKGYAGDGGAATDALLNEPYEVRFDTAGNLYFVEMQNHVIRRADAKSGKISTVAGTGQPGFAGDGGPAAKAQFRQPHSIALDGEKFLYVADIGNHRIRRIDLKQGTIETIAGTGEKKLPAHGGKGADQPVLGPRALFLDKTTLWVGLREGNSIWTLDLIAGTWQLVAGTGKSGFAGDDGPAKDALFAGPKGIGLGPDGACYVVDTENHAIRRIDVKSGLISTVAGIGPKARGFAGDGGPATKAQLNRPHGICIGADGAIYIGDSENHRVRKVMP